jgi:hypothetical protein
VRLATALQAVMVSWALVFNGFGHAGGAILLAAYGSYFVVTFIRAISDRAACPDLGCRMQL